MQSMSAAAGVDKTLGSAADGSIVTTQMTPMIGPNYGTPYTSIASKPVKNRILKFLCFNAGVCFN